jgi:hypothetical protein
MAVRRSPNPLVGVRFPPPEPTILFFKECVMKYLRVGLPFFVVFACIWNVFTAYDTDNSLALMGYVTALMGWIPIAFDEYLAYKRNKRIEDVTNSVA